MSTPIPADRTVRPVGVPPEVPAEVWLRQSDAVAGFTPSEGCWLTSLRIRHGDAWLPIVGEPPSWEALKKRPVFVGNPILFPWAYGFVDGAFTFDGQRYTPKKGPYGVLGHGIVWLHPWVVDRVWSDATGDHLRTSFTNAESPGRLAEFPFPFRLVVTHSLAGATLTIAFEATNLGETAMPMAAAVHPYISLPLLLGSDPDALIVRADVTHEATVAPDATSVTFSPLPREFDLPRGVTVGDLFRHNRRGPGNVAFHLTCVREPWPRQGVDASTPGIRWSLEDTRAGLTVTVAGGPEWGAMVLFAPPDHTVLSPVIGTCLWSPFNLDANGQPGGTITLPAGETWRSSATIAVTRRSTTS